MLSLGAHTVWSAHCILRSYGTGLGEVGGEPNRWPPVTLTKLPVRGRGLNKHNKCIPKRVVSNLIRTGGQDLSEKMMLKPRPERNARASQAKGGGKHIPEGGNAPGELHAGQPEAGGHEEGQDSNARGVRRRRQT